jgi:hypothetical protein
MLAAGACTRARRQGPWFAVLGPLSPKLEVKPCVKHPFLLSRHGSGRPVSHRRPSQPAGESQLGTKSACRMGCHSTGASDSPAPDARRESSACGRQSCGRDPGPSSWAPSTAVLLPLARHSRRNEWGCRLAVFAPAGGPRPPPRGRRRWRARRPLKSPKVVSSGHGCAIQAKAVDNT